MSYERFNELRRMNPEWTELSLACGSDYSGGLVERANYQFFLDNYADHADVIVLKGWFFGYGIGYNTESTDSDLIATVNALHDYPVADDEMVSSIQLEWENDAWSDWVKDDLMSLIQDDFEGMFEEHVSEPAFESALQNMFYETMDAANVHWSYEYAGAHVDVKRVYDALNIDALKALVTS